MQETIDYLKSQYEDVIDLTGFEEQGKALELKGSLVTDWVNGKIYCSLSQRADPEVFYYLIAKLNMVRMKQGGKGIIRGVTFHSYDVNGDQIYHTDCMMTLLSGHVVVCLDAIKDEKEKQELINEITQNDYEIIPLSFQECGNMCANMFDVLDNNGNHCVVMSQRAYDNYSRENLSILKQNYKVVPNKVDLIEQIGGGSCRCMLVELF